MTAPLPTPHRARWQFRRGCVLLLVGVLLGCGIIAAGGMYLMNVDGVVQRLQVTTTVNGGAVVVTGISWYGESGLMPWLEPVAALGMEIEVQNQDTQPLELASAAIIAHDGLGRTAHSAVFRYGVASPGPRVLLYPGDRRPVGIGGIILPMPQTWTHAEVVVTFKPADPDTVRKVVRWHDFVIQRAGMQPDGSYDLVGASPTAAPRTGRDGDPAVMISFYNAQGEFVRGRGWGRGDALDVTIRADAMPRGPITEARVFYTEAIGSELSPP